MSGAGNLRDVSCERALLCSGIWLLAVAALLGVVQHRHRDRAAVAQRWRVVHAGGTAGAVQLIAVAAVWHRLGVSGYEVTLPAAGLIVSMLAFFLGPLAQALNWPRLSRVLIGFGAMIALPTYLALPLLLAT